MEMPRTKYKHRADTNPDRSHTVNTIHDYRFIHFGTPASKRPVTPHHSSLGHHVVPLEYQLLPKKNLSEQLLPAVPPREVI